MTKRITNPKNDKELIGFNVRAYREEKGLTQKELAALVGVHQKTISWMETNHPLDNPSLKLLTTVAEKLGKTLPDLLKPIKP